LVTANLAIDTSQTSKDGDIRSSAPSSRSLVTEKTGTQISPTNWSALQRGTDGLLRSAQVGYKRQQSDTS
jgi:hypothetical protein